jgi:putative nucleotidyltransferase with HDIG domain/PAS domain S-box-containing protein
MAKQLPIDEKFQECEARFHLVEQSALLGLALQAAIADDSADGLFVAEPAEEDFRWTFVNRAFTHMHGLSECALSGELVSLRPETDRFHARCQEAVAAKILRRYEDRVDRPDCQLELQTRVTPVCDTKGNCRWIVGVCHDVTEQKLSERQLRKQNRRLQNILSSISDGFVVVDREWKINFLNPRAEQIFGAPRVQLIGASLPELFPDIRPDKLREPLELEWTPLSSPGSHSPGGALRQWISARGYPSQDGTAIYLQDITERKHAEITLKIGMERMQTSLDGVVNAMAFAVEMRDPYTGGHQRRVSALACAIARELGHSNSEVETLRIAGLLHDIGKISIPSEILNRPGKLSEPERIIVRTHAEIGYEILKEIEFDSPIALIALQHHERLDGSGYPHGIEDAAIIPEARILAIADVVEAMASHRPYRAALGVEAALNEVLSYRGVRYDDRAVGACLAVFAESGFDFDHLMQTELSRRTGHAEAPQEDHRG